MEKFKSIEYHGHTIDIYPDEFNESPDDWGDDERFLVYDHRNFTITRDGFDPKEIFDHIQKKQKAMYKGYFIFTVYAYIHSGVSLSLGRDIKPFTDRWDVSSSGFILIKKAKGTYTREKSIKDAHSLLNLWNNYLSGNVWGFIIESIKDDNSVWGYYGEPEKSGLLDEAKSCIDDHIKEKVEEHNQYLKSVIKKKIPILFRKKLVC